MEYLNIDKYKVFAEETPIELSRLTVLVGKNSIGKSSVIQALILLHEASKMVDGNRLVVNMPKWDLNLGLASDLDNFKTGDGSFHISYSDDTKGFGCEFEIPEDTNPDYVTLLLDDDAATHGRITNNLYYLSSERIGPRLSMPMGNIEYEHVGARGEYTAQVLAGERSGYSKIDENRAFPGTSNLALQTQVNQWLNFILPGNEVNPLIDSASRQQRVVMKVKGNDVCPTNVGFGISYVLPIIVNCLVADKDGMVIIENPEAHLHPSAQTNVAIFIAEMAKSGLTILVETHSDHFLDGLRLFAAENKDSRDLITINCFSDFISTPDEKVEDGLNQNQLKIIPIHLNDKFAYNPYVPGFMDQTGINYKKFRNILK